MLYLTLWFLQGLLSLLFNIFLILYSLFFITALFSLIKPQKFFPLFYLFPPLSLILFFSLPSLLYFSISLPFFFTFFLLESTPLLPIKIKLWTFIKKNLKLIITLREIAYLSDQIYYFLTRIKSFFTLSFSLLILILFISYHHLFLLLLISSLTITASLLGFTLRFFATLSSLPFTKSFHKEPLNSSLYPKTPSLLFINFLKAKSDSHPLNALIEENFFEENLQIDDFYLVYPIFYKATLPSPNSLSLEKEIFNIWHLIRWESALSKQTGSAASRWSSLFSLGSAPIHSRVHSIHTPLIPIYNEELFSLLCDLNFPHLNPFNQPPNWSPYLILISFLNWEDDEVKEERLKEIEEEDWQCSLNRTSSLHLDRGSLPPRAIKIQYLVIVQIRGIQGNYSVKIFFHSGSFLL